MTDTTDILPAGTVVHGYVIESMLGRGGFAVSYLAHDQHLVNAKVAIKEFFPAELTHRSGGAAGGLRVHRSDLLEAFNDAKLSFLQEGRSLAKLEHPGIVKVQRYFEANDTAYLVMEYVRGESLEQALASRSREYWTESLVRQLAERLLEALSVVHAEGLLHRDVNPSNMLLRPNGQPVLIDFGASRQALANKTRAVTAIITAGYSPPEQYSTSGKGQGAWTDLYALGATLYEVVTGVRPEPSADRLTESSHGDDPLTPAIKAVADRYTDELLAWIDDLLVLPGPKRPQSAAAALAALKSPRGTRVVDSAGRWDQPPASAAPPAAAGERPRTEIVGEQSRWDGQAPHRPHSEQAPSDPLRMNEWVAATSPRAPDAKPRSGLPLLALVAMLGIAGSYIGWQVLRPRPESAPASSTGTTAPGPARSESKPPAPVVSEPVKPSTGKLLVSTDAECALTIDRMAKGKLRSGAARSFELSIGEHLVACRSTARPAIADEQSKAVTAEQQSAHAFKFSPKMAEAQKAEEAKQADQTRLAEEARHRDEARRAEAARVAEAERIADGCLNSRVILFEPMPGSSGGSSSIRDQTDTLIQSAAASRISDVNVAHDVVTCSANILVSRPDLKLTIEGHTDSNGLTEDNLAIAEYRASAIRDMILRAGVAPDRVRVISYGEERPICASSDIECARINRRVELVYSEE